MKFLPLSFLVLFITQASYASAENYLVAAEDDWAPYSSMTKDKSNPEGFAVDVIKESFKTQHIDIQFTTVPFARCIQYAKSGKTIGCFDVTITDENKDHFYWHTPPLFHDQLSIFGPATAGQNEDLRMKDLEGKTVGITLGYTYPTPFMENQKIKKYTVTSDSLLIQMLASRRVDYILVNTLPARLRICQNPDLSTKIKRVGFISLDGF